MGEARDTSVSYYVYVSELPVDTSPDTSAASRRSPARGVINVIFRFGVSVHVIPDGARAEVDVESASVTGGDRRAVSLSLVNAGRAPAFVSSIDVNIIDADGDEAMIRGREIRRISQVSVLLPGQRLKVTVPVSEALNIGPLRATAAYDP